MRSSLVSTSFRFAARTARSARSALAALPALAACTGADAPLADARPLIDAPGLPDARAFVDAPLLGCPPPSGAGTTHGGSVNAAETWTAAASPHLLPYDTSVYAALTIEPCAVMQLHGGGTITINPGGSITAAGTTYRPVTFDRLDPGAAWATIRAMGGDLSLTHAIVRGGGDPLSTLPAYAGAIRMQRDGATGSLHVDDVEIADSASQGIYVIGNTGFDATSQDLRVHGAALFPVHVYANLIGTIPTGTYTGNGRDEIAIAGAGGPVSTSQTMHDRGVPYHVGSGMDDVRMDINASVGVAVLTIEPGVTMRFGPGGTLNIDPASGTDAAHGALIAIGTPSQKIVFTSDAANTTAMPGYWLGLGFGRAANPADALQYVQVAYAGGPGTGSNSCPYPGRVGQNDAAIRIFGTTAPPGQFITDTEIIASARDGIDRGWRDDPAPDFLGMNNSFDVAGCKQSVPRTFNGVCPATPACP